MKGAIIGKEIFSDEKSAVYNPSSGEILDYVPLLGIDEVRRAIDLADDVYHKYSVVPAHGRKKLLLRTAQLIRESQENLAVIMASETGRPIKSSRAEIERTAQIFEYCAWELSHVLAGSFIPLEVYESPANNENRIAFEIREPIGVVASITPFNFPGASFAHKVATALAVGNTIVHKPTKNAPLTQIELTRLILKAGFPEGSVNVVTGNSKLIGEEFSVNNKIRLLTFTGSSDVGLELAAKNMKRGVRSIMELGGSDAQVILDDAELSTAIDKATFGRYDYAGQFCNSTKRLIVSESVSEKVEKIMADKISSMKVGIATKEETDIGPLITDESVNNMKMFLEDALSKGSKIIYQGETPKSGFFFPPTLVRVSAGNTRMMNEEVFGPILPIQTVSNDEEAIEIVNSSKYGLNAAVFSKNFSRAYKIARKLDVGTVIINDTTRLRWDNLPFGGPKMSGVGRESVSNTMLEMTEPKVIAYTLEK